MKNRTVVSFAVAIVCAILPLSSLAGDMVAAAPTLLDKKTLEIAPPAQTASAPVSKPFKIGYVDIVRVGQESEYGKSVKAGLLSKKKELEEKVIAKRKQLDKLKQSIEVKLPTFTPKQREAESKKFQKKVDEFQKLAQGSEEEFMKLQDSETVAVYGEIEKTVAEYGKTTDLSLIMVKKELLYLGNGVEPQDITETILKRINEGWKKK